jgi:hypothetical protein
MITLSERYRPVLGPTRPHMQWVLRFFPVVKRPGCAARLSLPFSAEFKKKWSSTSTPTIL